MYLIKIAMVFALISGYANNVIQDALQEANDHYFAPRSIHVELLKDCPDVIPTLAEWEYQDWHTYDTTLTREKLIAGFQKRLHDDRLPLTFVAFKDSAPIGLISLEGETESELIDLSDGSPWGGSFHVIPEMRNQGIGEGLARTIILVAQRMGYNKIRFYTSNADIVSWYTSRGAQILETRFWRGHTITIMEMALEVNAFSGAFASESRSPHLTPEKLVGARFPKDTFGSIKVALVGYCPPPAILAKYQPEDTVEQYFIHIPPASVQIGSYGDFKFLSISHVYGGPVSSALIEELSYYGIKYVLAYGLAGGLGTKNLKLGDPYLIETVLVEDGTTPHYTSERLVASHVDLNQRISQLAKAHPALGAMTPVQAVTADAIYREYDEELKGYIANHCDVINCDSSHLFAVSQAVGIATTECGIVTDVIGGDRSEWDSTLSEILSQDNTTQNPLERVGHIVELYVEKLLPELTFPLRPQRSSATGVSPALR